MPIAALKVFNLLCIDRLLLPFRKITPKQLNRIALLTVDNINKEIRPSQPTLYYCNFHRQLLCFDYFFAIRFLARNS